MALQKNRPQQKIAALDPPPVPSNTTINNKQLNKNISLNAQDVGAVKSVSSEGLITTKGELEVLVSSFLQANRLVGRTPQSDGIFQPILLGANLTLTGNTLSVTGISSTTITNLYPNTSGGLYDTLTVNLSTGVCTTSTGVYAAGSLKIYKNGQRLVIGVDYSETDAASGVFTLTVIPLFNNDILLVEFS